MREILRIPMSCLRGGTCRARSPVAIVLVLALAPLACGRASNDAAMTESAVASSPGATGGSATVADEGCRKEGDWSPCAVEDRLMRAGVVVERQPEPVTHPFLSVPGVLYHVGSADHQLQVFLYPSAAARARDTDALDSATVSPKGTRVPWPEPPTLVTSNNLAAVILSLNDRTVERLAFALGAGLPQPVGR
ncbi:MAG: hypothetical protein ABIZ91_02830 [Gemmatimonadaceae bacterium]